MNSKLDLREPVLWRMRKGIGVGWMRVVTLVLLDAVLLSLAWLIAQSYGTSLVSPWSTRDNPLSLLLILSIEIGSIASQGLYAPGEKHRDYLGTIKTLAFSHVLLLIIACIYQPDLFVSQSTFNLSWLLSTLLIVAGRLSVNFTLDYLRQQGIIRHPIFLICPLENTDKAIRLLQQEKCYDILGQTDTISLNKHGCAATVEKIRSLGVTQVFVCSWSRLKERMFLYWSLRNAGITLRILPIDLDSFTRKSEISMVGEVPSIQFSPPLIIGSDFWVKRCLDFCCSALLLLGISPLFLLITLLIKLDSPGPVFYKQTRIGLHGQEFKVWKFRTMVVNAEKLQKELEAQNEMKDGVLFKMKSDPRITRVGKFLRRYSLDELPQLINVFLGQMSLIGPRPLPVRDIQKMSPAHSIRHEVLPGITGLWQVSGRSDITNFEEVVGLDMFYIENWSLWLDWQILLRTIPAVFQKRGAY